MNPFEMETIECLGQTQQARPVEWDKEPIENSDANPTKFETVCPRCGNLVIITQYKENCITCKLELKANYFKEVIVESVDNKIIETKVIDKQVIKEEKIPQKSEQKKKVKEEPKPEIKKKPETTKKSIEKAVSEPKKIEPEIVKPEPKKSIEPEPKSSETKTQTEPEGTNEAEIDDLLKALESGVEIDEFEIKPKK